jgi:hypothetical protein
MPKLDTAVLAASVIGMADEIMEGVRDNRDDLKSEARSHYVKAAIAGAIAIGAFEMLKKDEHLDDGAHHHPHPHSKHHKGKHHVDGDGHARDLVAEALGAYSLGRQMLGHKDHHILKLVAEGLGVAALAREVDHDLVEK